MFDARKQHPDNLFSAAIEAEISLEATSPLDSTAIAEASKSGVLSAFASLFKAEKPKEEPAPAQTPANDNSIDIDRFATLMGEQIAAAVKPASEGLATLQADFAQLKAGLESTQRPQSFTRTLATGGANAVVTDC